VELLEANELALTELGSDEAIAGTVEKGVHLHGSVVVEGRCTGSVWCVYRGPGGGWPECVSSRIDGDRSRRALRRRSEKQRLMADASVGHLYVGDSVLGRGVNFGAGTNVANLRHDDQPSA